MTEIEKLLEEIRKHKPWLEAPDVWATEAKYWTWLRGELRRMWTHYPPRNKLKMSLRRRVPMLDSEGVQLVAKTGKNRGKPRTRFELDCTICKESFPQAQIELDHIVGAGKCSNGIQACTFLFKLLCPVEHMRPVCKPCHRIHTYAERWGLTFEEARTKKRIIELTKKKVDIQKRELLSYGYTEEQVANKVKRDACYTKLVQEGKL